MFRINHQRQWQRRPTPTGRSAPPPTSCGSSHQLLPDERLFTCPGRGHKLLLWLTTGFAQSIYVTSNELTLPREVHPLTTHGSALLSVSLLTPADPIAGKRSSRAQLCDMSLLNGALRENKSQRCRWRFSFLAARFPAQKRRKPPARCFKQLRHRRRGRSST